MVEGLIQDINLAAEGVLAGGEVDWRPKYADLFKTVEIPDGSILDVGANESRLKLWLNWQNIERKVTSLDIRKLHNIDVRATAGDLPFVDGTFDSVTALYSVPQLSPSLEQEKRAVLEMVRVARKSVLIWPVPWKWFMDEEEAFLGRAIPAMIDQRFERIKHFAQKEFGLNKNYLEVSSNVQLGFPFDSMILKIDCAR